MRRLIILLAVLLLAMAVQAAPICNRNGDLEPGEECDPPEDANCPGMCNYDCTCDKESNYALFDLALGHNLLFSKVQDLLHVIKDMLFQLEMKTIEIQLTDFNCSSQPVSFWIPSQLDPYGKLNEIDQLIRLVVYAINKDPNADFGNPDTAEALGLLADAEQCIAAREYREAFECKCRAYRVSLLGLTDTIVCDPCAQ